MNCKINSILLYSSVFLPLTEVAGSVMRLWLAQVAGRVMCPQQQDNDLENIIMRLRLAQVAGSVMRLRLAQVAGSVMCPQQQDNNLENIIMRLRLAQVAGSVLKLQPLSLAKVMRVQQYEQGVPAQKAILWPIL